MEADARLVGKAKAIEEDIIQSRRFGVYELHGSLKSALGVDRISRAVKRLLEEGEDYGKVSEAIAESARRFNDRDWGDEAANRYLRTTYDPKEPPDWERSDSCPEGIGADGWYATPFGTLCIHRDAPGSVVAFLPFER